MVNNFTPLTTDFESGNKYKSDKKMVSGVKIIISFIFGGILSLTGIFLIITSVYGMKDIFLYTLQSLREIQHFNTTNSWSNLFGNFKIYKNYFTGISGVIAGNLFLFSGVKYIFHKKGGLKLLLFGLSIFFINLILAVIFLLFLKS